MISIRQILIIALLIAGFWLFRRLRQRLNTKRQQPVRRHPPAEEMVRCTHCGVYLPHSKAIGDSWEGYFCSEAHRLARQTETKTKN